MIHRGGTLCPPAPPLADINADNTGDVPRTHARFDLDKITHIISETWEIPERSLIERHERRGDIHTVTVGYFRDGEEVDGSDRPCRRRNGILAAEFFIFKSE
jgi:hypothetical protein